MRIVSVVFVGKQNEQLFFYCDEDQANRSHLQLVSHSCLDIVEEKKNRYKSTDLNSNLFHHSLTFFLEMS